MHLTVDNTNEKEDEYRIFPFRHFLLMGSAAARPSSPYFLCSRLHAVSPAIVIGMLHAPELIEIKLIAAHYARVRADHDREGRARRSLSSSLSASSFFSFICLHNTLHKWDLFDTAQLIVSDYRFPPVTHPSRPTL